LDGEGDTLVGEAGGRGFVIALQGGDEQLAAAVELLADGSVGGLAVDGPVFLFVEQAGQAGAGQLDLEEVGAVALLETGGLEQDAPDILDRPEEHEAGRACGALSADDLAIGVFDFGAYRNCVAANEVRPGQINGLGRLAVGENAKAKHRRPLE
jgi:hypothetical protein